MHQSASSSTIQILPEVIANQIAAGEVVQRPESVVKELVENSIDAGATEITVVVKNAGKSLIHIIDNGKGMNKEDLSLACRRHATSKISTIDDLYRISTLGFRGEALASICSVAQVEIRTRREDDSHGWKLTVDGTSEQKIEPFPCERGTQIFIRNIFFNIPARKKFLRSDLSEFRYISETMMKFALARPDIRFVFYDGDSKIFDVKAETMQERVLSILGSDVEKALIPIEFENNILSIKGFVGEPRLARQSRGLRQLFYLNGRHIISKTLNYAVFSVFEHLIEKNSYPLFVLFITLDPEKVDVNVHPQKHEVKFDDERSIFSAINLAVSQALAKVHLIPTIQLQEQSAQLPFASQRPDNQLLVNKLTGEIIEPSTNHTQQFQQYTDAFASERSRTNATITPRSNHFLTPTSSAFDSLFQGDTTNLNATQQQPNEGFEASKKSYFQLHQKYIVVENPEGMMIVDQHAAHERILYEKALQMMNREFSQSQRLLFPEEKTVSASEASYIKELQSELEALGFEFCFLSDTAIEVTGVPADIPSGEEHNALLEIIDTYSEYEKIAPSARRENLAASFGCKTALKTGKVLSIPEMTQLVDDLFKTSMPYVCQHGRPIILDFPLKELDKRFGRT
jgi:DNA mismatch repair protein MutL